MADRQVLVQLAVAGTAQFQRDMQSAAQATTEVGTSANAADSKLSDAIGKLRKLGAEAQQAGKILAGPPKQIEALAKSSGKSVAEIRAELQALVKAADEAGVGLQNAGDKAEVAAKKTEGSFAGMSGKVKGALAGIAFGAFVSDAISAASDLNETLNKSSVIFGDQAKAMEAWADGAATNLGLSKAAALDAAAGFGDMFSQLGFTSGQAADMSKSTVQLAADLGSFNNLGTDDVLDKISGAMRGEYDSLQALIPNINGARVEQEALTETGKASAAQLTAQEKATATLAIVTKDSSRAQGDFAKTSDGLANSQKIAAAQFEDTKAKIGQSLLPVMQQLVKLISTVAIPVVGALGEVFKVIGPILTGIATAAGGLVTFFGNLPGPIKAVVVALGAIAALKMFNVFSKIQTGVAALSARMTTTGTTARGLGKSLIGAFGGAGGLGLAAGIGAVTFLVGKYQEAQEQAAAAAAKYKQQVSGLADALGESGGAIDANVRKQALANVEANGGAEMAKHLGVSLRDLVDAQLGSVDALGRISAAEKASSDARVASGDGTKYSTLMNLAYSAQVATTGVALSDARELELQRADALRESAIAANEGSEAAKASGESHKEEAANLREGVGALERASELRREDSAAQRDAVIDADAYGAAIGAAAAATRDSGDAEAAAAAHKAELASQQDILNLSYESAKGAAETAAAALTPFEQASQDASDAQSKLADQAGRVTAALDLQAGRLPSLEEANSKAAAAGDSLADSFQLGTDKAEKLGASVLNLDGTVKTADEGGRTFREGILSTRQAMVDQATAAYAQAVATGNVAGASDAATRAQQGTYAQFIVTATAILGSKSAAEQAARAYNLIPSQVSSTISADDQASGKLYDIKRAAELFAQQQYNASVGLDTSGLDRQIASANAKLSALGRATTRRVGPMQYFAAGGAVHGPGTTTSDSIPALLSNDEHVFRADEVRAAGGHDAIYRLRRALLQGNAPRFASGGPVNGSGFAGLASRSAGDREGLVAAAFDNLLDIVKGLQGAAADMAKAQQEATQNLREAKAKQSETAVNGRTGVSKATADAADKLAAAQQARAKVATAQAEKVAAAERARDKVAGSQSESLRAARKRLSDAEDRSVKTAAQKAAKEKAIADAQVALQRASAKQSGALGEAEAKIQRAKVAQAHVIAEAEAKVTKARRDGTVSVSKAVAAQAQANRASAKKVATETRASQLANAASKAAADRARLATQVYDTERGLRSKQTALARRYDDYVNRVEATESRLRDLRDKAAGNVADGRSTALGIRGGLLGSNDFQGSNITAKDVRAQLQLALTGAHGFDSTVARAAKLGVSGSILDQLKSDPEGRGGMVLSALAGGTRADAAAANRLYAQLGKTGAVTGNRINSVLGISSQIAATSATLASQRAVVALTDKQLRSIGAAIGETSAASFRGQTLSVLIGSDGVASVARLEIKKSNGALAARAKAKGKR